VDRAALDAALALNMPCGGWCPKGRRAEDGIIDARYPLKETPSNQYEQRTEWNVRDSDGTLILIKGELEGGTNLTRDLAEKLKKPFFVVHLGQNPGKDPVLEWIQEAKIQILNVAGSRLSKNSQIYTLAQSFLRKIFSSL